MIRKIVLMGLCLVLAGLVGLIAIPDDLQAAAFKGAKTGNITGVVEDTSGNPVAGAQVQLYATIPGYYDYVAQTISGPDGTFVMKRIQPGNYNAVAMYLTPGLFLMGNTPVTVVAGQTVNITIVVD